MPTEELVGIVADAYEAVDWGRIGTPDTFADLTYGSFTEMGTDG